MSWGSFDLKKPRFSNHTVGIFLGNAALWAIYSLTTESAKTEFGASTFVYGIPHLVELIKKKFSNKKMNLSILEIIYSGCLCLGLISSFLMLFEKIPCHFGLGPTLCIEISHTSMTLIFLGLIVPKNVFFNIY